MDAEIGELSPGPAAMDGELDTSCIRDTLGALLRILQMRTFRAHGEAFGVTGLSPARHALLLLIRDNPGVAQTHLASRLEIQGPNMAKLVQSLEQADLILKRRRPDDARAFGLELTTEGIKLLEAIKQKAREVDRSTVAGLSELEYSMLKQLLMKALMAG